MRISINCLVLALVFGMSINALAVVPEEKTNTEKDASWGSILRDYICDDNGDAVLTDSPLSDFDLDVSSKSSSIKSVNLKQLNKGPGGQSASNGNKFIAVEITLGTPAKAKRQEFYCSYEVTALDDIYNDDNDHVISEDDELRGHWIGYGFYSDKKVSSDINIKESDSNVTYNSDDYDVKTVIKFETFADYAVEWTSSDSSKVLSFTTDTSRSTADEELTDNSIFIRFSGEPKFKRDGKLVLRCNADEYLVNRVENGELREEDAIYSSSLKGYVVTTNELTEFVLLPYDRVEEVEDSSSQVESSQQVPSIVPGYSVTYGAASENSQKSNPYLSQSSSDNESPNNYSEIALEEEVESPESTPTLETFQPVEESVETIDESGLLDRVVKFIKSLF